MAVVYIAFGEIDYEQRPVLGVEDSLEAAIQRCVNTPCTVYGEVPYDRWWIEEWAVGAVSDNTVYEVYEVNTTTRTARRLSG